MLLTARNLEKSYKDLKVLKNVSLDIKKGEFIAIIGPSGAGKSTLLHLLGILEKPDSGTITISGQELNLLNASKQANFRNKHIGFVFQSHHLLPEFSALENVSIPLRIAGIDEKTAGNEAKKILVQLGLANRLEHKPNELSGGEQQRVAIARAIIQKPEVIFADEPTGNLDSHTAQEINKIFIQLVDQYKITLIIVTHNEGLTKLAHRVLYMKDGMIVEERMKSD
ncbi:MAG TPA: ABC transporter ATP-binding protein [Edaphocola sp.]|nr:ABC transporter ATP-binding protein [Edaphocola sp.]